MHVWFYVIYMYTWKNISVLEKILSFGHWVIFPIWNIVFLERNWTLANYIFWCLISHMTIWIRLLVLKEGFQNIYFLPCNLLGISAYFNKKMPENCIFCDFEAWSVVVPMRSHALFYFFHYASIPRTQKP